MEHTTVSVLGSPTRTTAIASSLQRAGLRTRTLTPHAAHQSPGATSSAALTVLTWPPGGHPILESEIYGAATGALHVWWHAKGAAVGPYVRPGFGPCPACLASGRTRIGQRGAARPLTAWASAWAALQAIAIVRHGSCELMGSSWTWQLDEASLSLLTWPWRTGCPTRGCQDSR